MRFHLIAALLALPTLTACSGASADEEAGADAERVAASWQAEVEETLGTTTVDFEAVTRQAAADCRRTSAAAWVPTLVMSGDLSTASTEVTRIGLEHACPEVAEAFDAAVAEVEVAGDPLELVCGPDAVLEGEDALKAELVCASR